MRREEDDNPAKAPDAARSEEPTRALTTGFGQLDLAPPPGLLMRMPSTGSDDSADDDRRARSMPFDRQPSGASTDGGHSDSGVYGSGETTSMLPREVDTWTSEDVSEWLRAVGLEPLAKAFAEHGIDGYLLLRLTEHDLDRDLRIPSNLQRVKVYRAIENLRRTVMGRVSYSHASPVTFDAATSVVSGRETGTHSSASRQEESEKKSPGISSSGKSTRSSASASNASDGAGGVEADVSWLQYIHTEARPAALAEWLLQKTKEMDAEAASANPSAALNAYTQAALGALATIRANGPNDGSGSASDASLPSPPTSRGTRSSGSRGSRDSRGSRGSGSEFGVRLREALESTPGWNSEYAAFSSKPDVPWLQMRLADLVDDLNAARGNALAGGEFLKTDERSLKDFHGAPPAAVSAGLASGAFAGPSAAPPADAADARGPARERRERCRRWRCRRGRGSVSRKRRGASTRRGVDAIGARGSRGDAGGADAPPALGDGGDDRRRRRARGCGVSGVRVRLERAARGRTRTSWCTRRWRTSASSPCRRCSRA
jgi:hypothetical protein